MTRLDWDTYQPATPDEFDLCGACIVGIEHSVKEHRRIVREGRARRLRREAALEHEARRVEEQP